LNSYLEIVVLGQNLEEDALPETKLKSYDAFIYGSYFGVPRNEILCVGEA